MALIPLYEAKTYLRVDSSDEDALIGILLSSAEQMCKDVGRLSVPEKPVKIAGKFTEDRSMNGWLYGNMKIQ